MLRLPAVGAPTVLPEVSLVVRPVQAPAEAAPIARVPLARAPITAPLPESAPLARTIRRPLLRRLLADPTPAQIAAGVKVRAALPLRVCNLCLFGLSDGFVNNALFCPCAAEINYCRNVCSGGCPWLRWVYSASPGLGDLMMKVNVAVRRRTS